MWQLTSEKEFLLYHCAPELVVYNKSTRSTSLLPPFIAQIFFIIKNNQDNGVDVLNILEALQGQFDTQIALNDVEKSVEYLKELILIEYCE